GKLTARERIEMLFDKGAFVELDMFAQHDCHDFDMQQKRPLGDGVVGGWGKVNGRTVYAYAQDFTQLGGTVGFAHAKKVCNVIQLARETRSPIVALLDSGGARIQEGSGAYSQIFYENIVTSGVVPQISAVMGNCAGGGVYSPALTDFVFMVDKTSQMFITGPLVIKEATGEEITMQELGGAKPHSQVSGVCDFVSATDQDCIQSIRKLLGFLPSSYAEKPPSISNDDDPERRDDDLARVLPQNRRTPFDMRKVISSIVDNGDFLEVKAGFARNMLTGFARLNGQPVGIVANQPMVLAGCLETNSSDKAAKFYRTCDCYNIPIICLVDVPGYLPGVAEEHKGIIRHGAKMLYGFTEATVPKITCVVRKAYGGAYSAMGSKAMGSDMVFAWPSAEVAIMGPEAAVSVLYRKEIESAEDKAKLRREKADEYREKFTTPYYGASRQIIDIVIRPEETRPILIKALEALKGKQVAAPSRKHGNIPL
ncbi:MAG: acyl-CoA carboxylase subunit beta, partial [Dehalococcoidia bacterium]|nr:acyl-CoA carboxylase subunit beta [Dehalococcoidia bacterium]